MVEKRWKKNKIEKLYNYTGILFRETLSVRSLYLVHILCDWESISVGNKYESQQKKLEHNRKLNSRWMNDNVAKSRREILNKFNYTHRNAGFRSHLYSSIDHNTKARKKNQKQHNVKQKANVHISFLTILPNKKLTDSSFLSVVSLFDLFDKLLFFRLLSR